MANECDVVVLADLVIVGSSRKSLGYLGYEDAGFDIRDFSPIPAMDTLNHLVSTLAQLPWPKISIFVLAVVYLCCLQGNCAWPGLVAG